MLSASRRSKAECGNGENRMTGVVSKIFGGGDDGTGVAAMLAQQGAAQRQALASATNSEAQTDQQLATPRRRAGGRNLLQYVQGNTTLG